MADTLTPRTAEETRDAIRWALGASEPLEVIGGGTKRSIANPSQTAYALHLGELRGIVSYEPEELVLTLLPGTPMDEVRAALDEADQMLAFEPPDLARLLGVDGTPTFGGAYATNLAGPRRVAAGAVRDHMLGISAVAGRGEAFKAGGRVVKNVTGYDLARALAGSWGTLAVATELTVKVLPRPETEATVLVHGLSAREAVRLMSRAMGSSADVSGAAHLPAEVLDGLRLPDRAVTDGSGATALRVDGFGPSVRARADHLGTLADGAATTLLDADASAALWADVREVVPFVGSEGAVWRVSVAPTEGPGIAEAAPDGSRAMFDWAGGLVWIDVPCGAGADGGAETLRGAVARVGGGHATLIKAPLELRSAITTFHPVDGSLAALGDRLRKAFDPEAILNPGRMARQRGR